MALSDKEISALYFEALGSQHLREQDRKMVTRFAHAVEADVRKEDDALVLQLVEALEYHRCQSRVHHELWWRRAVRSAMTSEHRAYRWSTRSSQCSSVG